MRDNIRPPNLGIAPREYHHLWAQRTSRTLEQIFTEIADRGPIRVSDIDMSGGLWSPWIITPTQTGNHRNDLQNAIDQSADTGGVVLAYGDYVVSSRLYPRAGATVWLPVGSSIRKDFDSEFALFENEDADTDVDNFRFIGGGLVGHTDDGGGKCFFIKGDHTTINVRAGTWYPHDDDDGWFCAVGGDGLDVTVHGGDPQGSIGMDLIHCFGGGGDFRALGGVGGDDVIGFFPIAAASHAWRGLTIDGARYLITQGQSLYARLVAVGIPVTDASDDLTTTFVQNIEGWAYGQSHVDGVAEVEGVPIAGQGGMMILNNPDLNRNQVNHITMHGDVDVSNNVPHIIVAKDCQDITFGVVGRNCEKNLINFANVDRPTLLPSCDLDGSGSDSGSAIFFNNEECNDLKMRGRYRAPDGTSFLVSLGETSPNPLVGADIDIEVWDIDTDACAVRVGDFSEGVHVKVDARKRSGATGTKGVIFAASCTEAELRHGCRFDVATKVVLNSGAGVNVPQGVLPDAAESLETSNDDQLIEYTAEFQMTAWRIVQHNEDAPITAITVTIDGTAAALPNDCFTGILAPGSKLTITWSDDPFTNPGSVSLYIRKL